MRLLLDRPSPGLVWRTLRHLRARQIAAQLGRRLGPWRGRVARRRAPAYPGCRWAPAGPLPPPGARPLDRAALLDGVFRFVGREVRAGWPPAWSCPELPRLWQYNLHYFEWLWSLDYDAGRAAARDWIRRHDPRTGRVGWEPYPVSLRLVNWSAYFWGRHRARIESDGEFRAELWASVFRQAEHLRANLEFHLLGNHLLENAAALAVVGTCFAGRAARAWLATGSALLRREIAEQVLPDGMHFERSPMYHLRATYLLLLLRTLGADPPAADVPALLRRMARALELLTHPDGGIALLNDSALGVHGEPAELLRAVGAPAVGDGPFALPAAGYFGARAAGDYVICDAAPLGPDYCPAHGHADLLSFELSLAGRRVLVDAGTYDYEPGELRRYCRSTRAHNTVEVDGRDQCEMWGAFRVGRRARPRDVAWRPAGAGFRLRAAHDGYRARPGAPTHARELVWDGAARRLALADSISASRPVGAVARLHFAPEWRVLPVGPGEFGAECEAGRVVVRWSGGDTAALEPSWYCPEFGVRRDNRCLAVTGHGRSIEIRMTVEARR